MDDDQRWVRKIEIAHKLNLFTFRSFEAMFLLTASEVVLGTAIIMGLSAIVTVLLRVCSRPRRTRNQNLPNVPDEFGRTGLRVSLTSMQQRVMSKLRDRPPRYETRHNYEYQNRERSTRIEVLNPAVPAAITNTNIPPPAYDASSDNNSVSLRNLNLYMESFQKNLKKV